MASRGIRRTLKSRNGLSGYGSDGPAEKQTPAGLAGGRSFLTLHFATFTEPCAFVKLRIHGFLIKAAT